MTRERACQIMVCSLPQLGMAGRKRLLALYGSYEALAAGLDGRALDVVPQPVFLALQKLKRVSTDEVESILSRGGVRVTAQGDEDFPVMLSSIDAPPEMLFYRGALPQKEEKAIAIVGARKETRYGREQAEAIARGLAAHGVTVVSGLAYGVDAAAHQGALAAGGRTAAVLGSGILNVYPKEHQSLAERMVQEGGVLMSEYGLKAAPLAFHFPFRNRLVAGLAQGTLLIEAREKSGTLITVGYALDQGKEVFCLPGSVDLQTSAVPNRLIREGARLITSAQDILDDMGWAQTPAQLAFHLAEAGVGKPPEDLTKDEKKIYDALCREAMGYEDLLSASGLAPQTLNPALIMLEMKGVLESLPGKEYRLIDRPKE